MGGLRLSVRTLVSLSMLVATSEAQDAELSAATADRRAAAAQGGNGKYILHSYILNHLLLFILTCCWSRGCQSLNHSN